MKLTAIAFVAGLANAAIKVTSVSSTVANCKKPASICENVKGTTAAEVQDSINKCIKDKSFKKGCVLSVYVDIEDTDPGFNCVSDSARGWTVAEKAYANYALKRVEARFPAPPQCYSVTAGTGTCLRPVIVPNSTLQVTNNTVVIQFKNNNQAPTDTTVFGCAGTGITSLKASLSRSVASK